MQDSFNLKAAWQTSVCPRLYLLLRMSCEGISFKSAIQPWCPTWASTSSAIVPWPDMTRPSLYGGMKCAPDVAWTSAQVDSLPSMVGSHRIKFPPYALTASTLHCGVPRGTTMCAGIPRNCALRATAPAWFPLLCVTTPCAASSVESERTALQAPGANTHASVLANMPI